MYVHLGEDIMIRSSEIIAILEKNTVDSSDDIQLYLNKRKNEIINLSSGGIFKSLIMTSSHIYLSPIATTTLKKRLLKPKDEELFI